MQAKAAPILFCSFLYALLLSSCSSFQKDKNEVVIWELSDPETMNPINYTDAASGFIANNIYQPLLNVDFKTLEIVPVLAEKKPDIEKNPDGTLRITYTLRKDAVWDNGTPLTAKDVEFTLKAIKNPKVNNQQTKPAYEDIGEFISYPDNPRKFTLIYKKIYLLAPISADFAILPEYVYDPKGLMRGFSVKQLTEDTTLAVNPNVIAFADDFNSEKRMREKNFISGSGAYTFEEWKTGKEVVLKRKKNWWGDKVNKVNCYFEANPEKITYRIINDETSALVSLKGGNLDVMRSIKAKDFVELPQSQKFRENFNSYTPLQLTYNYFGINILRPKFTDRDTREALAHLVDADKMIQTIQYGMAQRVWGPVHPSDVKDLNTSIVPYDFNLEKAKDLLAKAGWKDSNGDGTLDKMINGERVDFVIDFSYNQGNDERKAAVLLFQEEARKVGITVNIIPQEWSVYTKNLRNHNFDMYVGRWVQAPVPWDPKQVFHSESANGGSNYVSLSDPQVDNVIDSIRTELDESKRSELYKRLQTLLHHEVSYIYLFSPSERIVIHKRFSNAEPSVMRPGYWEPAFRLASQEE